MSRYPKDLQRLIDEAPPEYKAEAECYARQLMERRRVSVRSMIFGAMLVVALDLIVDLFAR